MDAFFGLFASHRLLFTVPLLFSMVLGSLSVIGLLDLEALDLDVDLDADADLDADVDADAGTGGGDIFSLLGLGMIPFSLLLIILCFSFGWFGLAFESLLGDWLAAWIGGPGWGQSLLFSLPAFVAGLLVTVTARLLHPFFKDHGEARSAQSLVGKRATLETVSVSSTFGKAVVMASGSSFHISVRTHEDDDNDLGRGDPVLIFDYDDEHDIYYVSPLSEDDVLNDSA